MNGIKRGCPDSDIASKMITNDNILVRILELQGMVTKGDILAHIKADDKHEGNKKERTQLINRRITGLWHVYSVSYLFYVIRRRPLGITRLRMVNPSPDANNIEFSKYMSF